MNKYKFKDEEAGLTSKREAALKAAEELEMPESIRTPGRTWTKYPELDIKKVEGIKPEISSDGEIEVFTGQKAVEEAGDKLLNAVKTNENKLNAYHTAFMNSIIYIKAGGDAEVNIVYDEDKPVFSHLVVETEQS